MSISALTISGPVRADFNEFIRDIRDTPEGSNLQDLARQYEGEQPYRHIYWTGHPRDGRAPERLNANEEWCVPFAILDVGSGSKSGYKVPMSAYFASSNQEPTELDRVVRIESLFQVHMGSGEPPFDVRPEVKQGLIRFQLQVGAKSVVVPRDKLLPYRRIPEHGWKRHGSCYWYEP